MPNCDFYALAPDLVEVLDFVFAQPGWSLIELASRPDRPLQEFHATRELVDAHEGFASLNLPLHFQLYCPAMGGRVSHLRIDFKAGAVPGATFRYDSGGWGLIQLYFGRLREGQLSPSHTNHNSQRRAENWEPTLADRLGPVTAWNWGEIARMSGRLNRFIRGAAAGKLKSRPILREAHGAQARGAVKLALI